MEEEKLKTQKKHDVSIPLPEVAREVNPLSNMLESKEESHEAS